jgi:hypothetical protein
MDAYHDNHLIHKISGMAWNWPPCCCNSYFTHISNNIASKESREVQMKAPEVPSCLQLLQVPSDCVLQIALRQKHSSNPNRPVKFKK